MPAPAWFLGFHTCNCNCQCLVLEDTFDRALNASLGANWTETDWSISSNQALTSTSNANAITTAVAAEVGFAVRARGAVTNEGSQIRLIFAWTDASNYLFVEFVLVGVGGACGTIKFFERVAGVETQVGDTKSFTSYTVNSFQRLAVCYKDGEAEAHISSATRTITNETDEYAGTYTGLKAGFGSGTITGGSIRIDDFSFYHFETFAACPSCTSLIPCASWRDDFNRADTTNIGTCDWDEAVGDSTITSNTLRFTTAGAVAIALTTPAIDEQTILIRIQSANAGDRVRAMVRVLDEDNYLFAEVRLSAVLGSSVLVIGSRIAGVETELFTRNMTSTTAGGTGNGLQVCYYGNTLTASGRRIMLATIPNDPGIADTQLSAPVAAPAGQMVAVGTGSVGTDVRIDRVETYKYQVITGAEGGFPFGSSNPGCVQCFNGCSQCDIRYQPHREYIVDLGLFGALSSDPTCIGGCESIIGEYTVTGGPCGWSYSECGLCELFIQGLGTRYLGLGITLRIANYAYGNLLAHYEVIVRPYASASNVAPCPNTLPDPPDHFARYISLPFNEEGVAANCQQEEVTLYLQGNARFGNPYCSGEMPDDPITLPDTIEVRRSL